MNNSVLVIVEHFLTERGRAYFQEWIDQVRNRLKIYNGFQALYRIYDPENPNRTLVYITFGKLSQLKAWSSSEDHEEILRMLRPYQTQKQQSQIYTIKNYE